MTTDPEPDPDDEHIDYEVPWIRYEDVKAYKEWWLDQTIEKDEFHSLQKQFMKEPEFKKYFPENKKEEEKTKAIVKEALSVPSRTTDELLEAMNNGAWIEEAGPFPGFWPERSEKAYPDNILIHSKPYLPTEGNKFEKL